MSREDRRPIERRWQDAPPRDSVDDGIATLLRRLPDQAPLPPAALARIKRRIARSLVAWPRLPGALRWVAAALVLGTGGVVVAHRQIAVWVAQVTAPRPANVPAPGPHPRARRESAPGAVAASPPPAASAAVATPPARSSVAAVRVASRTLTGTPRAASAFAPSGSPAPVARSRAPDTSTASRSRPTSPAPLGALEPPPAEASPLAGLGTEALLLRRALESLRHDGDPAAALADLDEHRARFPAGVLRPDADLVRVDALLALGRRAEALSWLESLPIDVPIGNPRAAELRVTRGELRAATDCGRALSDFDEALAQPLSDRLAERALRGRGACRVQRGDTAGAARDLKAYLTRFPDGPFAPQARVWLGNPRPTTP